MAPVGKVAPDPAAPAGPVAPVAPVAPATPCGPVAPAGPVGPTAPADPVGPVGSSDTARRTSWSSRPGWAGQTCESGGAGRTGNTRNTLCARSSSCACCTSWTGSSRSSCYARGSLNASCALWPGQALNTRDALRTCGTDRSSESYWTLDTGWAGGSLRTDGASRANGSDPAATTTSHENVGTAGTHVEQTSLGVLHIEGRTHAHTRRRGGTIGDLDELNVRRLRGWCVRVKSPGGTSDVCHCREQEGVLRCGVRNLDGVEDVRRSCELRVRDRAGAGDRSVCDRAGRTPSAN